jgi:hypothetical protein
MLNGSSIIYGQKGVYKVYTFEDFMKNPQRQVEFSNELAILRYAKE